MRTFVVIGLALILKVSGVQAAGSSSGEETNSTPAVALSLWPPSTYQNPIATNPGQTVTLLVMGGTPPYDENITAAPPKDTASGFSCCGKGSVPFLTFTPGIAGSYQITVTDSLGAKAIAYFSATETTFGIIPISGSTITDVPINLFVFGGSSTAETTLRIPNGMMQNQISASIYTVQASKPGTYPVKATRGPSTVEATITVNWPPLTVEPALVSVAKVNEPISFNLSGGSGEPLKVTFGGPNKGCLEVMGNSGLTVSVQSTCQGNDFTVTFTDPGANTSNTSVSATIASVVTPVVAVANPSSIQIKNSTTVTISGGVPPYTATLASGNSGTLGKLTGATLTYTAPDSIGSTSAITYRITITDSLDQTTNVPIQVLVSYCFVSYNGGKSKEIYPGLTLI